MLRNLMEEFGRKNKILIWKVLNVFHVLDLILCE